MSAIPAPLLYWARERERIRQARLTGADQPWTSDLILQTYRFCNLRRADDRVSQWLLKHVLLTPALERHPQSYILFTALCRWINWPPTIKAIMDAGLWPQHQLDFAAIVKVMDSIPDKVWTGAYMIRAKPGNRKSKAHFVVREVIEGSLGPVQKALLSCARGGSLEGTWELLMSRLNWGSFMAGQVVADWSYTPLLNHATDLYTWAPQGPGSRRGFNRLLERPLNTPIGDAEWINRLYDWRGGLIKKLGPYYECLTLHDVQNALCEVDKYLRVKNGEGRPRSRYQPETMY